MKVFEHNIHDKCIFSDIIISYIMGNLVNIFWRSDIEIVCHPDRRTVSWVDNKDTSIL